MPPNATVESGKGLRWTKGHADSFPGGSLLNLSLLNLSVLNLDGLKIRPEERRGAVGVAQNELSDLEITGRDTGGITDDVVLVRRAVGFGDGDALFVFVCAAERFVGRRHSWRRLPGKARYPINSISAK